MNKTVAKIICLIMAVSLSLAAFAGCEWITTNTDRDMAQVIATVQISDQVEKEEIYKRQLVSGYVSYGYQYVQYYSYTLDRAYQAVLDNLVNNRIVVQQSRIELAKTYNNALTASENTLTEFEKYFKTSATAGGTAIDPKKGDIETLKKYLTEYEIAQVNYNIRKSVNNLIDTYADADDSADEKEDVTYTARTAPTEDEEEDLTEEELKLQTPEDYDYLVADLTLDIGVDQLKQEYTNTYDLNMAVWKAYKIDLSTTARKRDFNSVKEFLVNQGLINSEEVDQSNKDKYVDYSQNADNILNYTYFADNIKSQLESAIVAKYEDSLTASVQETLLGADATYGDSLWGQYKVEYENQKALYRNDYSAYETALNSASDTSLVLYNPFEGYGYVANLLIGFNDEQTAQLNAFKATENVSEREIIEYRAMLARQLYALDRRDSWVYLNYGTYDNGVFTFEDKYTVSDIADYKRYLGTVEVKDEDGYEEKDDNGVTLTKWNILKATPNAYAFDEFVSTFLTATMGMEKKSFESTDKFGMLVDFNEETLNKIKDAIYVFSTDPGSLSNEYGYLYSPYTSATNYVPEFAAAAKLVVEEGVGAYTMVITDYGIHVIVCTKIVEEPYDVETDEATFKADMDVKGTVAYNYKQIKLNAVTSSEISKIANKFINSYRNDETKVKYFTNAYKDLTETSAS